MSDYKVKFTNLMIPDGRDVARGRKVVGAFDPSWPRLRIEGGNVNALDRWIEQNIEGRWGSYSLNLPRQPKVVVIAFENETDATFFKLSDGENKA